MSSISGVFNRDGEPVSRTLLSGISSVTNFRGRDGSSSWADGRVGMTQQLTAFTPEAIDESQPLHDENTGLCIVFYGRVDNRDELIDALVSHGIQRRGQTDMEIVLRAYQLWDVDCTRKILGDFSFVIWDAPRQRLYCARDIIGIKPLYYFMNAGTFVFGTEVSQVLQHPDASLTINEGMVAEHLALTFSNQAQTLYQDVSRLPAAHYLCVDAAGFKVCRYWDIQPRGRIRYRHDDEYLEHFLEIFRETVACRLRSFGPPGAYLSGGLDSPCVVGMAQSILNETGGQEKLQCFTTGFPGREVDETSYIQSVVEKWGVDSYIDPFYDFMAYNGLPSAQTHVEPPDHPANSATEPLQREAEVRGVRVLLTGTGAYSILGGSNYSYPQLIMAGEIGEAVSELRWQISERGGRIAMSRMVRSLLWPLLPTSAKKVLARPRSLTADSEFLQPGFCQRVGLKSRLELYDSAHRFSNLALWENHQFGVAGVRATGMEMWDRYNARYGQEERHPFLDKRLIDFASAIPDFQHRREGQIKRLLLYAGLIPDTILNSNHNSHYSYCTAEALKTPQVKAAMEKLAIAEIGWVSRDKVSKVYSDVSRHLHADTRIHYDDYQWLGRLWQVYAVDKWFSGLCNA